MFYVWFRYGKRMALRMTLGAGAGCLAERGRVAISSRSWVHVPGHLAFHHLVVVPTIGADLAVFINVDE